MQAVTRLASAVHHIPSFSRGCQRRRLKQQKISSLL
jgi:hypothetical protein